MSVEVYVIEGTFSKKMPNKKKCSVSSLYTSKELSIPSSQQTVQKCIQDLFKHLSWSFFAEIISGFYLLTIFVKSFIIGAWQGPKYASAVANYISQSSDGNSFISPWSRWFIRTKVVSFNFNRLIYMNLSLQRSRWNDMYKFNLTYCSRLFRGTVIRFL